MTKKCCVFWIIPVPYSEFVDSECMRLFSMESDKPVAPECFKRGEAKLEGVFWTRSDAIKKIDELTSNYEEVNVYE